MRRRLEVQPDWRSEVLPLHLRGYARPMGDPETPKPPSRPRTNRAKPEPNDLVLVFDTETTIDPSQRLRVLFYQLRIAGRLDEEAAAYDPAVLNAHELATLRAYCANRGLPEPMSLDAFRKDVFLGRGYDCGAEIVGFNLPFDLARIALAASPARVTKFRYKMRGGFTLKLSEESWRPKLQVKHLSGRAALFEFTSERRQHTSRPGRRKGDYVPVHRGHFTDVRTLAAALTSRSHSLKSLTRALGTKTQKTESEKHGGPLTFEYLDYARSDVQATWECFDTLVAKYRSYGLGGAHWEILSEAGLGKATLAAMGIRPWLAQNPNPSSQLLARILSSYFGGRTEVRWRKAVRQVFHTDFTSMYPTVCTLMRLWRFIVATGFETRDATGEARAMLADMTAAALQEPTHWPRLAMLVKVRPHDDLLPVRTGYCESKSATIGLNHLMCDEPIWLTLADCIVAKILTGKAPEVVEAVAFDPGPVQAGLKPIRLFGQHRIDPRTDDLFRRVIQLRIAEKARAETLVGAERQAAEDLCQSLKITANSTSYGIFIQVNVDNTTDPTPVEVFGPDGGSFITKSRKMERPGPHFHPLLATLITGAARLMLALAEHRAIVEGLDWVFCDTDSLALARPDGRSEPMFLAAADRVMEWFLPLDPYGVGKSILKAERANFSVEDAKRPEPLYCLAISSKRYVLFNTDAAGTVVSRKGSAHGLGHLLPPYDAEDTPDLVEGDFVDGERLPLWQHDLWKRMVELALQGRLHEMRYDWHPSLRKPALSRYSATTPEYLRWFSHLNAGRDYADQVKPFGFLYALHAKRNPRGHRVSGVHPIAPFSRTPNIAVHEAFDRLTGEAVHVNALQTFAEALAQYHLSPEAKFRNGEAFDVGKTERRHVRATGVEWIGKEADRFEEAHLMGLVEGLVVRYGTSSTLTADIVQDVGKAAEAYGDSAVARATGLSRAAVVTARLGRSVATRKAIAQIRRGLTVLKAAAKHDTKEQALKNDRLRKAVCEHGGLRPAARALGIDPSNLQKRISAMIHACVQNG